MQATLPAGGVAAEQPVLVGVGAEAVTALSGEGATTRTFQVEVVDQVFAERCATWK